jgi:hypothetical protein
MLNDFKPPVHADGFLCADILVQTTSTNLDYSEEIEELLLWLTIVDWWDLSH